MSLPETGRQTRKPHDVRAEMDDLTRRILQAQEDERQAYQILIRAERLYVYTTARLGGRLDFPPHYVTGELTGISLKLQGGAVYSFRVHPGWSPDMPDDPRPEPPRPEQPPSELEAKILDVVRLRENASMGEIVGKWPKEEEQRVRDKVQEMVQAGKIILAKGVYSLPEQSA
jgi:hypothetical protein